MSPLHDINIAIMAIGFAHSLYAGIMLLLKKNARLSDRVLAAWLFFISLQMLLSLFNTRFPVTAFPFLPFIYGPLLYIYINTLIPEHPRLRYYYSTLAVPLIAFFIVSLIYRKEPVLALDSFLVQDSLQALRLSYAILLMVSFLAYSILTFIKLNKHRIKIRDLYSYTSQKITLGWALFVSISFFVLYALLFIIGLTRVLVRNFPLDPVLLGNVILVFYAFAFSIFGYQQDRIYPESSKKSGGKYARSGLRPEAMDTLKQKLLDLMEKEHLYREPELSILDVSNKLHVPRHHVTQVLNEKLGKNFYTFINGYRVEEAKTLLKDPKNDVLTVLAIGYDAGFNSKSSFNTLFKESVGVTPSEYRKRSVGA
ncbi:MAG: helix-turn-helix domain-containing protein [Candidatus Marinimicrobia bacterium]|jgi:AraC-like DNA-binding protein|nr:helix-turn-helix domain-containing protein [Candidatus Neomarinimicrobiota bacterium]MDD5709334.1 helix-turn-helix domain-containing protein [Candidatus Neomarinimicrobiota bacterium]MDX9777859.1 helix-turn-helix domain-containing protein [bacterium]